MSLLVSLLALISWACWGYTVLYVEPSGLSAALGFYCSLFVALTCTIARLRESPPYVGPGGAEVPARPSLGHGATVSVLLLFALWLQSLRMLSSLNLVLLVLALGFVELGFALTRARRPNPKQRPRRARTADAPGSIGR